MRKVFLKNSIWMALDYATNLITQVLLIRSIIHHLGVEGYGFYSFFMGLYSAFGLMDFGMGLALSKYLCEYLADKKMDLCNQVLTLGIAFYASIGVLVTVFTLLFRREFVSFLGFEGVYYTYGVEVIVLLSIALVFSLLNTVAVNLLMAYEAWMPCSVIGILFKLSTFIMVFVIFWYRVSTPEVTIFYGVLLLTILRTLATSYVCTLRYAGFSFCLPQKELFRKIFVFLRSSSLQFFLTLLAGQADKFIVNRFFGLEALGIYNFCFTVFNYLFGFLATMAKMVFPRISRLHAVGNETDMRAVFWRFNYVVAGIHAVLAGAVLAFWDVLVTWYVNAEFAVQTWGAIVLFMIYMILKSPEIPLYYFYNGTAQPDILLKNTVLIYLIMFVGYAVFIGPYGIYGLIVSAAASSILVSLWNWYAIQKRWIHFCTQG